MRMRRDRLRKPDEVRLGADRHRQGFLLAYLRLCAHITTDTLKSEALEGSKKDAESHRNLPQIGV